MLVLKGLVGLHRTIHAVVIANLDVFDAANEDKELAGMGTFNSDDHYIYYVVKSPLEEME